MNDPTALSTQDQIAEKVQYLLDQAEIDALITNFAQGADNPDLALHNSVFAPDVVLEWDGMETIHGLDALVEAQQSGAFKAVTKCELTACTHAMINRAVKIEGENEASGIVHAITVLVGSRESKPYSAIRGLYYEDQYRRIDGRWYISHRRHTLRWLIEGENAPIPAGYRLAKDPEDHPWG